MSNSVIYLNVFFAILNICYVLYYAIKIKQLKKGPLVESCEQHDSYLIRRLLSNNGYSQFVMDKKKKTMLSMLNNDCVLRLGKYLGGDVTLSIIFKHEDKNERSYSL